MIVQTKLKLRVYSKKRAEAINKIKGAKENQGYQGLLSGMTAEKKDSFCLVVKGRMSSFEQIEPEEELSDDHGPKIILVSSDYSEESVSVYKNLADMNVTELVLQDSVLVTDGMFLRQDVFKDTFKLGFCSVEKS